LHKAHSKHAETVTEEHVEEWSAFLQNEVHRVASVMMKANDTQMAAADGGNAPGIIDLVPPKLLAEWHREALATLRSEVLEPVGGSLQKLEQADPDAVTLNEADLNAEAKCIGALVSALVER
jgi:hypothetical protein